MVKKLISKNNKIQNDAILGLKEQEQKEIYNELGEKIENDLDFEEIYMKHIVLSPIKKFLNDLLLDKNSSFLTSSNFNISS